MLMYGFAFISLATILTLAILYPRKVEANIVNQSNDGLTRGERNNNPTNLEFRDIGWVGEIGTDGRYSIFDTAEHGIRAAMRNLHTMFYRDNLRTVREAISRWAPQSENPTDNYIDFVAERIGVSPDTPLDWHQDVIPLTEAIVYFENGKQPYDASVYQAAFRLTGK